MQNLQNISGSQSTASNEIRVCAQESTWESRWVKETFPLQGCQCFNFRGFLLASDEQLIAKTFRPAERKAEEPETTFTLLFFLLFLFKGLP